MKYAIEVGKSMKSTTNSDLVLFEIAENFEVDLRVEESVVAFFNALNNDLSHFTSRDDICTPMECVKLMLDYLPQELWDRDKIAVLDPCSGNGNFGAYCQLKTDNNNIWYNELNPVRFENCKRILAPANATNEDFFQLSGNWDLIMANPPYSGGGNKNRGLSNQFIERSIDLLNDTGYLCFVTPNNWMTFNNNNTTLEKLLQNGSFVVIDNDVKKFFPGVGSSFTIFVWQKGVMTNLTTFKNSFLKRDIQQGIKIPRDTPFIPLYCSQVILDLIPRLVSKERNDFDYRCDLHNFTQKKYLSDHQDEVFKYKTIHTMKTTRFASKKQDIFDRWNIIVPLSTYYVPKIMTGVNTTQSVGYVPFESKSDAEAFLKKMTASHFKLLVHVTRYGNFNNLKLLKHLRFTEDLSFSAKEAAEIKDLVNRINY